MEALSAIAAVEDMIEAGISFEAIEAFIDEHAVDKDLANVLWLLAWCETDPEERRAAVRELLVGLA